jgi:ubiquinone/menaquinone biosynthesis C-methylase UbiE
MLLASPSWTWRRVRDESTGDQLEETKPLDQSNARAQWEGAAPGWARWEATLSGWFRPATEAMLDMAQVDVGRRVLDLASGAGSQTLLAARRVGPGGYVVANDISRTMLEHVEANARAAGFANVGTLLGPAEDVVVTAESFDAVICQLGLMLFVAPAKALLAVRRALRNGARIAVVVFTTPAQNAFMARPMQILLRHAGKSPPEPGKPGIFSLGAPGVIERLFGEVGFVDFQARTLALELRMSSSAQALLMMQEAFGAYRAVINGCSEAVQSAAWTEVGQLLAGFEQQDEFVAPSQLLVASAANPG